MAMTLRLPPELEAELRTAAEEDRRSVQQTVLLAIETFLARRETAEVKADAETLRALADAREQVAAGEVYSTEDVVAALNERRARSA
jgi:predicted transcriptional regulator